MNKKGLKEKIYEELKRGVPVSHHDIATQYGIEEMTAIEILEELKAERKVELIPVRSGNQLDPNNSTFYKKR